MRVIIGTIAVLTVGVVALIGAAHFDLIRWQKCDVTGSSCCGPDGEVKTEHCHKGLGCNITTGKCAPCGTPGQPCCDGDYTGFSLKGYTGILLDASERIDSCNAGASCDARLAPDGKSWLGTRICQSCGTREGGSCCAPDDRHALGRCFTGLRGTRLTCNDPWAGERGTCIPCGRWHGDRACLSGLPCGENLLAEKDGFCVDCGRVSLPICDSGEPCRDGVSAPNRNYNQCVEAGDVNQPCMLNGRCRLQDGLFCNSLKICEHCGDGGESCCPAYAGVACTVGECRNNRCFACGYMNMPACPGNDPCRDGSEPVNGFCSHCGREGERCCYGWSIVCNEGMRCDDGTCERVGGGGAGGGEELTTCSGQPITWTATYHAVAIEVDNGCIIIVNEYANTPEEALQCARADHGEAVIDSELGSFMFAVNCPGNVLCDQVTFPGRDQESAENCVQFRYPNCTVDDGPCP